MRSIFIMLIVGCVLSFPLTAQQNFSASMLKDLERAEEIMLDAISHGDSAMFRKISDREYFTINANGEAQSLNEAVVLIPQFKGSTFELSQRKVRLFDNFALRTGRAQIYIGANQVAEVLYTSGWVYRKEQWRLVHWQGTPTGMLMEGKGLMKPPKN